MSIFRTAIFTIAHFLLAGVYLFSIFGLRADFGFVESFEPVAQVALWAIYAIYILFTFPLTLIAYIFPGLIEVSGESFIPVWLLLQLAVSYIQVRTIGRLHITVKSIRAR